MQAENYEQIYGFRLPLEALFKARFNEVGFVDVCTTGDITTDFQKRRPRLDCFINVGPAKPHFKLLDFDANHQERHATIRQITVEIQIVDPLSDYQTVVLHQTHCARARLVMARAYQIDLTQDDPSAFPYHVLAHCMAGNEEWRADMETGVQTTTMHYSADLVISDDAWFEP